jgi:hypothetical protein
MLCRSGFRPGRLLRPCIVGLASPACQLQANGAHTYTLHMEVNQSRRGETRVVDRFRRGFGLLILTCPEAGVHCLGCLNGRRSRGIRCLAMVTAWTSKRGSSDEKPLVSQTCLRTYSPHCRHDDFTAILAPTLVLVLMDGRATLWAGCQIRRHPLFSLTKV